MNVVVFGATGGVGRLVVGECLARGHGVRALAREPGRLEIEHERLQVVSGDVRDALSVRAAVAGMDAAIVSLGKRRADDDESVVPIGVANVVAAMEEARARRLVFLSLMGVGDSRQQLGLMRHVLPRVMRTAFLTRAEAEAIIRSSDLDWVIARAVRLVDGHAGGTYRFGSDIRVGALAKVARQDVAECLVDQLSDHVHVRRAANLAA